MSKGVNKREIKKLFTEIQREMDKQSRRTPLTVPVQAEVGAPAYGGSNVLLDGNSETGLQCLRLLEWLYRKSSEQPNMTQQVYDYMNVLSSAEGAEGDSGETAVACPSWLLDVIALLEEAGLLERQNGGLGGSKHDYLKLTSRGRGYLAERKERLQDLRLRRAYCRRNLLRWLYDVGSLQESPYLEEFCNSIWGTFEGDPYAQNEASEAKVYLEEEELLRGDGLALSSEGVKCVEEFGGWVSDYNAGQKAGGASFINHFHQAIDNLQVAQGNRDVQQSQTIEGFDGQTLVGLAEALREAAPVLGLSDAGQAEIIQVSAQLQEAAQSEEPSPERIRGVLGWGQNVLGQASGSALGSLLTAAITSMM